MNLIGKMLNNRYEVLEKVGNGGMATVYKAKCHVLNRFVAVKVLRDEFTTDEEFIKRFEVEAQSAASITHPNIVSVYDVGVDGNLHYIVMELIKGKTLKDADVKALYVNVVKIIAHNTNNGNYCSNNKGNKNKRKE